VKLLTGINTHVSDDQGELSSFCSLCRAVNVPRPTTTIASLRNVDVDRCQEVVLYGYLISQRKASSRLYFAEILDIDGCTSVQVKLDAAQVDQTLMNDFKSVRPYTPVSITGKLIKRASTVERSSTQTDDVAKINDVELSVKHMNILNEFPKDIIVATNTVIPPEQRHLQMRTDKNIRDSIRFRSRLCQAIRDYLCNHHKFTEVETPILFKSTPEGAHEFLVPTRTAGLAYALPQSPQQYKQILMASGISRYMQIAKCFRDEDLRADRQPEFTQVDLEMAFSGEEEVMAMVEGLVKHVFLTSGSPDHELSIHGFPRVTYEYAMSNYGSDKPDTRFDATITRIDYMLPADLVRKITDLTDPVVECIKLPIAKDPNNTRKFVNTFMDSIACKPFMNNPDGRPGIFIYNSRQPLGGLAALGFEAAEQLENSLCLEDGDLLVLQARPNKPFSGGSTMLGNLRLALHKVAVSQGLLPVPSGWNFLWVVEFPLFSPMTPDKPSSDIEEPTDPHLSDSTSFPLSDLGQLYPQLESTHHPFTAPLTAEDTELLLLDPTLAKAAHYDLVLNGVEIGGGSRRIHHTDLQRFVLQDILKLSEERMATFSHLLEVLRAGAPPHAGMALGLDRLIMLMLGKESVRDVIAFPKWGKGEDVLVKAPSRVDDEMWKRYHLKPIINV